MNLQIQRAQQAPSKDSKETHIETHYNQTVKRQGQIKNLESSKRGATYQIAEILNNISG